MFFHIDYANTELIDGWLTPDNPSTIPRFMIETDLQPPMIFEANTYRPDLVDAGLHDTGLVGFRFDDRNVPSFSQSKEVTLTELNYKKVIYRRDDLHTKLQSKFFLLNNIPVPSRYLRSTFSSNFLVSYVSIDEVGIDTAGALLRNNMMTSIFAEGRMRLARHFRTLKSDGYYLSALLEDPFIELANRLLVVKFILGSRHGEVGVQALSPHYSVLKDCVKNLDDISVRNINSIFSSLSQVQKSAVTDPLIRMLGCADNDEPEPRHVSTALATLSEFNLVGTINRLDFYKKALNESFPDIEINSMAFSRIDSSTELAENLQKSTIVRKMLRNDIRLYHYVEQSIQSAVESQ